MYKEDKKNIGWLKIIVRVVIAFLIFMLVIKLISMGISMYKNKNDSNYMKDNLKLLDKAAKEFFKEDKLPSKLGKSNKIALKKLIDERYINQLKDEDGNVCSIENSFIQATKLDSEYQIKSYLECGDDSDYLSSFIKIEDEGQKVKPTTSTTKKVTKKTTKTTKKTSVKTTSSTTKRVEPSTTERPTIRLYYSVKFNTNGGSFLPEQSIRPGSKMAKVIPKRIGYKFLGWYYNGKEFDMNTKIYKDYVLVAKWAKE